MNSVQADFGRAIEVLEELRTKDLEDAINICEWGRWSRGGMPTGKVPLRSVTPNITDDEALAIDRQVAQLPEKAKVVIIAHYVRRMGVNEMASKFGVSKQKIIDCRSQGLNMIYGALKNA